MSSIINKTKLRTLVKLIRIMLWLKKESIKNKKLIKVDYSATKSATRFSPATRFGAMAGIAPRSIPGSCCGC